MTFENQDIFLSLIQKLIQDYRDYRASFQNKLRCQQKMYYSSNLTWSQ